MVELRSRCDSLTRAAYPARVRVLLVSHRYPPAHTAGTELYAAQLAAQLAARGHDVQIFCAEKDVGRRDLTLHRREHEGLVVHELVQNMYLNHFRDTWDHPRIEERFQEVLREVRPDVVHVHHLLYLSSGMLAAAKASGARVVMTLHDFWFECPRFGQLVHADGEVCHEVDTDRCGTCLPTFPWRQSDLARGVGKVIAGVNSLLGVDFSGAALAATRKGGRPVEWAPPSAEDANYYKVQAETRSKALRSRALEHVDLFLAPSAFLANRMVEFGLPQDRVEVLASGVDRSRFGEVARTARGDKLRVRFLGTLVPLKGAHVLLDAIEGVEGLEVSIHGPDEFQPSYVEELRERAASLGVEFGGALDRAGVAEALGNTDVLVVPSLWFENRPLIILEALASKTPLLVSDLGGLIELVEDGDAGWRFPFGDAQALAAHLIRLRDDPAQLAALPFARAEALLPSWAEVAERHEERYQG